LSPIDKYTIQRSQQIIAQEFERSGLGQLQIELSDDESSWQSVEVRTITSVPPHEHQPKTGVVNEHCQVHGTSLIAGSSVFPTSGLSNTLTICALAIRLADHIKTKYSVRNLTKLAFQ